MADPCAHSLDAAFAAMPASERLRWLRATVPGRIVFTTSLGLEDQVLTHLVAESGLDIELVTLDTGRLFPEVHELWAATEERYGLRIHVFAPERDAVEALVARQGILGFRRAVAERMACCDIRKVQPLARALAGAAAWITGLRADQSAHRAGKRFVTHDPAHALLKANPLLDWTREETARFAARHAIPVNPLHGRGFLSIGCAPCTRALAPGAPERAGRWWWEQTGSEAGAHKECGLHVAPDGRLIRARPAQEATP
jgi:phosphoadenosine phosphosulfate reductase